MRCHRHATAVISDTSPTSISHSSHHDESCWSILVTAANGGRSFSSAESSLSPFPGVYKPLSISSFSVLFLLHHQHQQLPYQGFLQLPTRALRSTTSLYIISIHTFIGDPRGRFPAFFMLGKEGKDNRRIWFLADYSLILIGRGPLRWLYRPCASVSQSLYLSWLNLQKACKMNKSHNPLIDLRP